MHSNIQQCHLLAKEPHDTTLLRWFLGADPFTDLKMKTRASHILWLSKGKSGSLQRRIQGLIIYRKIATLPDCGGIFIVLLCNLSIAELIVSGFVSCQNIPVWQQGTHWDKKCHIRIKVVDWSIGHILFPHYFIVFEIVMEECGFIKQKKGWIRYMLSVRSDVPILFCCWEQNILISTSKQRSAHSSSTHFWIHEASPAHSSLI